MSGVDVSFHGYAGPHIESEVMPLSTADKLKNIEPSTLASLSNTHPLTKAVISFDRLSMIETNQFYNETVDHVSKCPTEWGSSPSRDDVQHQHPRLRPRQDKRGGVQPPQRVLKIWISLLRTFPSMHLLILLPLTMGMRRRLRSASAQTPMVLRSAMPCLLILVTCCRCSRCNGRSRTHQATSITGRF